MALCNERKAIPDPGDEVTTVIYGDKYNETVEIIFKSGKSIVVHI